MFALQSAPINTPDTDTRSSNTTVPNILPCRIHHDGPLESIERYWKPLKDENGHVETTHFRGRKLRARRVAIPEGYKGVVAVPTDRVLHSKTDRNTELQNGEQDEVLEEPVKVLDAQSTFDEFVVWGHEIMPAADDPFVKGVEEWMKFAEAMHLSPQTSTDGAGKDTSS